MDARRRVGWSPGSPNWREAMTSTSVSPLWAITSYFNPCRYRTRLANFKTFRARLRLPLVAVELAYGESFELELADADILIRLRGEDVLWQKERLLNLALEAVPDRCEAVAWLDCDVVFADPHWSRSTLAALERDPVIQPYRTVYDLPRGQSPDGLQECPAEWGRISLASGIRAGTLPPEIFRVQGASLRLRYSPGHAWAARRSLLRQHGLYDAMVMGSGDKAMVSAAYGHAHDSVVAFGFNDRQAKHYLAWAVPFHQAVRGHVGFTAQTVFHLWHGRLSKRSYGERYDGFDRFAFDPYKDIRLAGNGCWSWATDKPEMHEQVRRFFSGREEDSDGTNTVWSPLKKRLVTDP
jgi:hypothetical protein